MNRLITVKLFVFVMLLHELVCAQGRTLLAEGDYVGLGKSGAERLLHWKLWHLDNGEYEAVDTSVRNPSATQTFRFNSQFMPIGFSKSAGPLDLSDSPFPKVPGYEISCEYKPKELICEAISGDGTKSIQTVPAVQPYVVAGEFYDLDFTWFMTGVVHLASSGKTSSGLVNVYALTNGNKPAEIGLKPDKPILIVPDGDGTALILGRMQRVRKFKSGSDNALRLVGTDQGLIARLNMSSSPETGYSVDNYTEYVPWGVPFGNISHVAAANAPDAASEIAGRVQVPSGIIAGLLVHRVQPEYPTAAKLNKIQGKVVLRAVINTEGKVTEVSPLSGPQELLSAAVEAVKEWQYRPYMSQGQPVEVETQIVLNFALPK